jgi:hypothetical protein
MFEPSSDHPDPACDLLIAKRAAILAATILERHEPFLIRLRLVGVTPFGRVAS